MEFRKVQWPTIPVWWQKKGYCSDMPNVVSTIDETSHEIQIPSNEPHHVEFKTLSTGKTLTPKHE
jgi:hypothetical protein